MNLCTVEETVESSTFLATNKSLGLLMQFLNARRVDGGWCYFAWDRGEKRLLIATESETEHGSFIHLWAKANHLMMTSAEFKSLQRSSILTLAAPLSGLEPRDTAVWANSGTLTRLQSTLSKLADEE